MNDKTYKSITEVSELLNINKHVIRYWDSRSDGISTRLGVNKRRFFSNDNIKKLQEIKNILYNNKGKSKNSIGLANLLLNKKNTFASKTNLSSISDKKINIDKLRKISDNLKKII